MPPDFLDKPTREACDVGITILVVGKPTGTLLFFLITSGAETK